MSSLREKIKGMVSADENVEEFDNLVLDEAQIEKLTAEDKEFIEEFKNLEMLSFNLTKISSLDNFPTLPSLKRVELADNYLKGTELVHLCGNTNLMILKLGNNKIAKIEDLNCFAELKSLTSLDLVGNPVCDLDDYQEKVFELIPSLKALDGFDQEGDEVDSMDDDYGDEDLGEEGEEEIEEQIMAQLTEEQKVEMADKGMTAADYLARIQAVDFEDGDEDDYGEEGEEEDDYGEENGDAPIVGDKRQREDDDDSEDDVEDEGAEKRKKEE